MDFFSVSHLSCVLIVVEEGSWKEGGRPYRIAKTNTFAKPDWFDIVTREYEACRETVGLCDYSSFTKIDLTVNNPVIQSVLTQIRET